jgi:general secretion pathway protein L
LAYFSVSPNVNFATSAANEISFVTAIGLGLEGLKRAKNPAVNFLKAEFARQSEALRMIWDRWRLATITVAAAFLILFVWSFMREGYAIDMATNAGDKLRDLARKILNEKRVPEPMIRAYIKEQEQKAKMKKLFEELQSINSPLDILKKITQIAPNRSEGPLFLQQVSIENEILRVTGETTRIELLTRLQAALKGIAKDGQVQSLQGPPPSKAGYRSFSYSLRINRKASP